jgi:ABC-type transport system involved in multi-copper enzyme maturation permease subunit
MLSIIRFTLITALRDLLFIGLLAVTILAIYISSFLGNTALVEQEQMTLSYMAGSTRFILVIGLILFVCFHVRRAFDNKEIEVILSKPISRTRFIIAYWSGFALLSVLTTLPVAAFVSMFIKSNNSGLLLWGVSLILEGVMMVAFAMLSSLIMRSAVTSALSSLCFYFMSRMMGFFVATIYNKPAPTAFSFDHILEWLSEQILIAVSTLLPRLDLFAKTKWLIYSAVTKEEIMVFVTQSLVYIPLLLLVAIFDFRRKQF